VVESIWVSLIGSYCLELAHCVSLEIFDPVGYADGDLRGRTLGPRGSWSRRVRTNRTALDVRVQADVGVVGAR
jgi:hypothetical protein